MRNDQSDNYSQDKTKKVAVMTRAANGVGKSIAIGFARAGYIMMINDVVERELKQTVRDILSSLPQNIISTKANNNAINHNNHISYFAGDISKEEVSISLMEETIKKFGTIDVLINNATILGNATIIAYMPRAKECICDWRMTNSNTAEFMIIGSRIELRCRKCNGVIRWWNEDNKKIIPLRRAWSDEECSAMR